MFITQDPNNRLVAKIAAIGPGGSGKTRVINTLANYLAEKELYPWDEEKNLAGTIAVTPYTLKFKEGKIIVSDNPGQDSFEKIRNIIARQGDVYQAYLVCLDSIAWSFKDLALSQLISISEGGGHQQQVPVVVLVNKKDIHDTLLSKEIFDDLVNTIYKSVQNINSSSIIKFYDRVYNKSKSYPIDLENEVIIPFTKIEQLLVNDLEMWSTNKEIPGFTTMNVRIFVRAFLLGYCVSMAMSVNLSKWPAFKSLKDPNLVNRLNYHRPTAFETASGWERLGGKLKEPPILKQTFDPKTIATVLKRHVFSNKDEIEKFIIEMNKLGQIYKYNVISTVFDTALSKQGVEQIEKNISFLIKAVDKNDIKEKPKADDVSSLGLDDF